MKAKPKVINNIGYTISLCGIVEAHITSGVTALFIDSDDVATMVEPLILMNDRLRLEQGKFVEIPFGNPMPEYYFRLEPHRLIKTTYWAAMPDIKTTAEVFKGIEHKERPGHADWEEEEYGI